ncbi:ABC transporter G family member 20 [Atta colombica]|uniref:ABC transporter G family member 20 n=1 Tax=Atta colombica TaxID=520822 RepID=A0A195BPC9_9HYME|nr:ABC transporter G family member 20 [Atta colombica]
MVQREAVVIRNAVKRYGKELVFNGLNMTVSRGSIYGLLGSSGCGKTTLLSCIVGIRYLDSGEVWVLGGNPDTKDSGIPGPRVGYMPQEISLVGEFSVSGAFYYFGRINGLDDEEIETRQRFFSELLQLPPANRLVKNISGGQQRKVSLAVALIHKPKLLILDEPTVGLDPILREKIWAYMIQITQEENITVLITTHYIEETKDANKIGLIRCGKLLAESAPQELLEQFQSSSLEETFLKLCNVQNNTITLNEVQEGEDTSNILYKDQNQCELTKVHILKVMSEYEAVSVRQVSRLRRFKALLVKNSIQFLRYYAGVIFAVVFPILQIGTFIIAIGNNPKNLKIGVVNDEVNNCSSDSNFGNVWNDEITCHFDNLSCRFLHNFDSSIAIQEYYDDFSEAKQAVQNAKLSGLIYFSHNFSKALLFEEPIYGTTDFKYTDYMIPTYILGLSFFLAATVSITLIITDRMEGVWDRSVVQGIRTEEILLSHILIQSVIIIIHTITIMLLIFPIWGLECKGSIFTVMVSTFFSGFCGLMYGFIISVTCKNLIVAHYSAAGSFFLLIFLNGSMWPIEGMPKMLRWFSYALPTTLPSISLREIIYKGYSISKPQIYIGLLISIGWSLLFLIISIFRVKLKSL